MEKYVIFLNRKTQYCQDVSSFQPVYKSFPGGSVVKNLPASEGDTGDVGLIPGSGK